MEEEGWLEEKGGLTFPTTTSRVYTVNKYDGSLRVCVLLAACCAAVVRLTNGWKRCTQSGSEWMMCAG